jgi:predicted deacylase
MTSKPTTLWSDIDFERDGKQIDWLYLPHSVTRSAYGEIMIPIAVVKRGTGPTVLLMAGNHGDEYEGQIALAKLIRTLEPEQITGRVIILPAANLPAAMAGTRVSPIDGGNLNREFPGNPEGTVTSRIAHYIESVLLPMCDGFHDLHSGGASLQYLPFASMRHSGDADLDRRSLAALRAFAPPIGMIWSFSGAGTYAASAANNRKVANLGGEFGGSGAVDRAGVALVEGGIRRFLAHFGVLSTEDAPPATNATRLMEIKGHHYYVCPRPWAVRARDRPRQRRRRRPIGRARPFYRQSGPRTGALSLQDRRHGDLPARAGPGRALRPPRDRSQLLTIGWRDRGACLGTKRPRPQPLRPVRAMFSMMRRRSSRKIISIGRTLTTEPAISLP